MMSLNSSLYTLRARLLGMKGGDAELEAFINRLSVPERFTYSVSPFPGATLWFLRLDARHRSYYGLGVFLFSFGVFSRSFGTPMAISALIFILGGAFSLVSFWASLKCFFWWIGLLGVLITLGIIILLAFYANGGGGA